MKKLLFVLLLISFSPSLHAQPSTPTDQPWRGLMIDVSRHFMPISFLERQIDAMHYCGLNRLHLHLTDAAGWRMEIKRYPRLTSVGAWRTAWEWKTWWNDGQRAYADSTAHGGYYTQDQLRQLVAYASERGVEIVPEIEFPAHSEEVVAAYPSLGYNHAELDIENPNVYDFMHNVLTEVCQVFPSEYIHLGGDEAATQHERQPAAMRRINAIVRSLGRKMIAWDEALTSDPADSTITIMVWRNADTALKALALGHHVILSPGAYCYLDKYQDAPTTQPEAMGGYLPLREVWERTREAAEKLRNNPRFLGLQTNLWTEYIPTEEYAEYMIWPRAMCLGSRFDGITSWTDFQRAALKATRHLRREMGIQAFPLHKEIGQRPEYGCPAKCLSTGKPVTYNSPYHPAYPASGATALTDGLRGGWANTDGRWQGFISKGRLDVTIDLGQTQSIRRIHADFMQNVGPEIFLPSHIIISASTDGQEFYSLYNIYTRDNASPVAFTTHGWRGKTRARYIRYQALSGPRGGWVFTDEILVE